MATHVGIMSAGRLLAQGALTDVLGNTSPTLQVETVDLVAAAEVLTRLGVGQLTIDAAAERVSGLLGELRAEDVNRELVRSGIGVRSFGVTKPALEDLFVSLTGEGFDVVH